MSTFYHSQPWQIKMYFSPIHSIMLSRIYNIYIHLWKWNVYFVDNKIHRKIQGKGTGEDWKVPTAQWHHSGWRTTKQMWKVKSVVVTVAQPTVGHPRRPHLQPILWWGPKKGVWVQQIQGTSFETTVRRSWRYFAEPSDSLACGKGNQTWWVHMCTSMSVWQRSW